MMQTASLEVDMSPAPFVLGGLLVSPDTFDASSPGLLGQASISFHASAPGSATIVIRAPGGGVVFEREYLPIESERTVLSWNGRDKGGRGLPAGDYRIDVSARGTDGAAAADRAFVTLSANHTSATYSSLAGGFSGSLLAPDARILPEGRLQAGGGGYAVFDPSGKDAARAPLFGGFRFGFPGGATEFSASFMGILYPGYDAAANSWSAGASLKTRLFTDETWAGALLVGGNYASYFGDYVDMPPPWDGPARYRGGYAGLVFESDSELARAFFSGEVQVSDYYPNYDIARVPGFFSWAYLRGGLEFFLPDLLGSDGTLAVSAAGRSAPFADGLSFALPLSVGAELHWYFPAVAGPAGAGPKASPGVLSLYASGEWASRTSFYLGGGLGLGFLL